MAVCRLFLIHKWILLTGIDSLRFSKKSSTLKSLCALAKISPTHLIQILGNPYEEFFVSISNLLTNTSAKNGDKQTSHWRSRDLFWLVHNFARFINSLILFSFILNSLSHYLRWFKLSFFYFIVLDKSLNVCPIKYQLWNVCHQQMNMREIMEDIFEKKICKKKNWKK